MNVHLKNGKNSPQRICPLFDLAQMAIASQSPIKYIDETKG